MIKKSRRKNPYAVATRNSRVYSQFSSKRKEKPMSTENKTLARRVREEIWSGAALSVVDQIIGANCVNHVSDPITPDFGSGPEGFKKLVTLYRSAFPDALMTIDESRADGDK